MKDLRATQLSQLLRQFFNIHVGFFLHSPLPAHVAQFTLLSLHTASTSKTDKRSVDRGLVKLSYLNCPGLAFRQNQYIVTTIVNTTPPGYSLSDGVQTSDIPWVCETLSSIPLGTLFSA